MPSLVRIETLTIGDELLLGIRTNTHLTYLGDQLCRRGLSIARNVVIPDDAEEIRDCFRQAWANSDLLITTGGLGPTDDDLTRETIASCLGRTLVHDPDTERALRERFEKLGRTPTANNLKQCYILEGAEAIPNRHGTAPGQWMREGHKILIMLPGPASELKPMWEDQVLPRLTLAGLAESSQPYLQIRTAGIGESKLENDLRPIFDRFPGRLRVAYCAHAGLVDLRLSSYGHSLSEEELAGIGRSCREALGEDFVCFGDCCLGLNVLRRLRANGRTLAVAESCTGGLLASTFTDIPGASKVFLGGIVCYANDAKVQLLDVPDAIIQQHGAVSAECAVAMATGVAERFDSDYALSITGFAGPEGGTLEQPVGTVFLGLSCPHGVWAHRVVSPGNRIAVKERAVVTALDWLRRKLETYEVHDMLDRLQC